MATDQLEIRPIERKQFGSNATSTQRQKDIIQHLLDLRLPTGLLLRYSRYNLAGFFPIRKARSDYATDSFKNSGIPFDEPNGLSIKRSSVKLLHDNAGEISLKDQRQKL